MLLFRVSDDDVAGLIRLDQVATVELVYHVGTIQSPGIGTHYFMQGKNCRTRLPCGYHTEPRYRHTLKLPVKLGTYYSILISTILYTLA